MGVPEITPDEAFRLSPADREPLLMLHEYGAVPPLACNVAEYAVPTVPPANDEVDTAKDVPPEPDAADLALNAGVATPAQPHCMADDAIRMAAIR